MDHEVQTSKEIEGVSTTLILQPYGDAVMVLVTQLGKVGNLIQVSIPATTPLRLPPPGATFPEPPVAINLTPLLGAPPSEHIGTLHSLYASQLATLIWAHEERPDGLASGTGRRNVIVGLALKKLPGVPADAERATFVGVMEMLKDSLQMKPK